MNLDVFYFFIPSDFQYIYIYFQAVPLFLSEIAPTRIRGGLNILFQLNVTIGILFANLVNYGTAK